MRAAYELLVAMSLIFTFIPLMLMFAAAFRLADDRASAGAGFVSSGVVRWMAASGFLVVAAAMLLALVPAADQPHPGWAVAKLLVLSLLLIGVGTALFLRGNAKRIRGVIAV